MITSFLGLRAFTKQNDPQLADTVLNGTTQQLGALLNERAAQRQAAEMRRRQLERQLALDPFNVELQRQIEAQIQQEAIDRNMEMAIEYTPESFAKVVMLYIDAQVNDTPIKAFVGKSYNFQQNSLTCCLTVWL